MIRKLKLLLFSFFLITCCTKESTKPDDDPYRYQYPHYRDGFVVFYHSFYRDCGDSAYWVGEYRSKEFNVNDSLFLLMSEEIGIKQEIPNLTNHETAVLECSNGDVENVIFNLPYPPCIIHIDGVLLYFGAIPSQSNSVVNNNGFIDMQSDSIEVVAKYKSYWTGRIVTDTAYVYP